MIPRQSRFRHLSTPRPSLWARHGDRSWHVLALAALALFVLGAGCQSGGSGGSGATLTSPDGGPGDGWSTDGGPSDGGPSDGGSADAGWGTADYTSAPPPQQALGGDDSSDVPLLVDDPTIDAVAGSRLYHLSGARGLLVFDVTDVDHPALVGSAAMSGTPQALYLVGNVALAVLGDWHETAPTGPFHGSVVRALDCTDPAHIALLGEVRLPGLVQASRLRGGVLYAGSTDQGEVYGAVWGAPKGTTQVVVTSIAVGSGAPTQVAAVAIPGDQGTFAFGPGALAVSTQGAGGNSTVHYVDLHDPGGAMTLRGAATVSGSVGLGAGYCGGAGVWNLDFSDGVHARAIALQGAFGAASLATIDFTQPDAPVSGPLFALTATTGGGQGGVTRFDVDPTAGRAILYVSHASSQDATYTALDVYDVSGATPLQVGSASFAGDLCSLLPLGSRLFSVASAIVSNSARLDVRQFDVTTPSKVTTVGAATVTFDRDAFPGASAPHSLVANPAGTLFVAPLTLNPPSGPYAYGLQIFTADSVALAPSGQASLPGPLQRAVFVQDRVYALTDQTITVLDVSQPSTPRTTGALTFAGVAWAAVPLGSSLAELSSDPNARAPTTDVRLLPPASAGDTVVWTAAPSLSVPGTLPEAFASGALLHVWTTVCVDPTCATTQPRLTVVDTSGPAPRARGSTTLPSVPSTDTLAPYAPWAYGWFMGPDVVLASPRALVVRRPNSTLPPGVIDVSNPDAPTVHPVPLPGASGNAWWGNLRVLGGTVYATTLRASTACVQRTAPTVGCTGSYFLVPIDVSDPAHPTAGNPVSVPGIAFGVASSDPSTILLVDYQWAGGETAASITTCKLAGGRCERLGSGSLGGLPGLPRL